MKSDTPVASSTSEHARIILKNGPLIYPEMCVVPVVCLGAPFAWSLMSSVLSRAQGVVASSAADWTIAQATIPMQLAFGLLGHFVLSVFVSRLF